MYKWDAEGGLASLIFSSLFNFYLLILKHFFSTEAHMEPNCNDVVNNSCSHLLACSCFYSILADFARTWQSSRCYHSEGGESTSEFTSELTEISSSRMHCPQTLHKVCCERPVQHIPNTPLSPAAALGTMIWMIHRGFSSQGRAPGSWHFSLAPHTPELPVRLAEGDMLMAHKNPTRESLIPDTGIL